MPASMFLQCSVPTDHVPVPPRVGMLTCTCSIVSSFDNDSLNTCEVVSLCFNLH